MPHANGERRIRPSTAKGGLRMVCVLQRGNAAEARTTRAEMKPLGVLLKFQPSVLFTRRLRCSDF
jgi:hypothetical protein